MKPRPKRTSGVVVPSEPRWYQRVVGFLIWLLAQTISATLRYRWVDHSGLAAQDNSGKFIFAIWHNRLAMCLPAYYKFSQRHGRPAEMAAMVSASKDGGFLTGILECFRVHPVRGSTSRRGPQALLELTTWANRGCDLAITPDGPRGPRHYVHEGIMSLSQLTGLAILPVSYRLGWKIEVKSWDRFQIPLPFSVCEVRFAPPLRVPRDATDAEREQLRLTLENTMKELAGD